MRSVGYNLNTAIADIVDNSIAAEATRISILYFDQGKEPYIAVVDDGWGMDEATAFGAMQLAGNSPNARRASNDLGRFGLGLKAASLSQARSLLETLIDGRTDGINANALNHLLTSADKCGFQYVEQPAPAEPEQPGKTGKPSDPVSPSTPEHARRPQPDIDQYIDYQRDFLTAITPDTWRTILEWARYRNIMTDEALAGVAKIEKHIRLTDEQTRHLWAWRQRMISRGFPASQFAPRPGTY